MSRFRVNADPGAAGAQWTQLYLGLGFTTLATVILELSLTRLLTVIFYDHFAFMVISLALLGLAAGGLFSYVIANRPGNLSAELGRLAFVCSVTVVLLLWFLLSHHGAMNPATLLSASLAGAVPFFFAGTVISLALGEAIERVERAWFFDLAGAAAACALLAPFLRTFGGPNTVITAGVLFGVASAIWFNRAGEDKLRALAVLVALLLVTLMVVNGVNHIFDVRWAKGERLASERSTRWNTFSRVGVGAEGIRIDAGEPSPIPLFDWTRGLAEPERRALLETSAGLPYLLRPAAKALILGAGGGLEIARALAAGSLDIAAVEPNPIVADTMLRGPVFELSHGLYALPRVHAHVEDGRGFLRRSTDRFRLMVVATPPDGAGAFASTRSSLFTTQAVAAEIAHLTGDGLLVLGGRRADPLYQPRRLAALASETLAQMGETNPAEHIVAVRDTTLAAVLVARQPWPPEDLDQVRAGIAEGWWEPLFLPDEAGPTGPWPGIPAASGDRPATDDRPFFFFTAGAGDFQTALHTPGASLPLVVLALVCVVALALVALLARPMLGARLPRQRGVLVFQAYFALLGAGYMLVQVGLLHRFVAVAGSPAYALLAIVMVMLAASAAGSLASRGIVADNDTRLLALLAGCTAAVGALAFGSSGLVDLAAAWPTALRIAVTALATAPAAFLMGMPFPAGLSRMARLHAASVRWAWSTHAAAGVLGAAGALALAIELGLRATLLIGALLYLGAGLVILATRKAVR